MDAAMNSVAQEFGTSGIIELLYSIYIDELIIHGY